MKTLLPIVLFTLFFNGLSYADEGMWIPLLLEKYTIEDMKDKGLKLTQEDIYSINQSSLKDAIVMFGGGCSGAVISDSGLIITNHTCAYDIIKSHSDADNNLLENGYWAKNWRKELPNPGLSISFLVRIEDVTLKILDGVNQNMTESERDEKINENIEIVENLAQKNTHLKARVKSFYFGTQFFMFITEEFYDVRLVGTPPLSIANFGRDSDNWKWPRHAANFALFRIYADKENKPTDYSQYNNAYKSKKTLPLSLKGAEPGQFSMIYGYPGRTSEYLPSYAVEMIKNTLNPHKTNFRKIKRDILKNVMDTSEVLKEKYAFRFMQVNNYFKKGIAENQGLEKANVIRRKQKEELKFSEWLSESASRQQKHAHILDDYKQLYQEITPYRLALEYINESIFAIDIIYFCRKLEVLLQIAKINVPRPQKEFIMGRATGQLREEANLFFQNYDQEVDKIIAKQILQLFRDSIPVYFYPGIFNEINNRPFKGDIDEYVDDVFEESTIVKRKKLAALLIKFDSNSPALIREDPVYKFYKSFDTKDWKSIRPEYFEIMDKINSLNRTYLKLQKRMNPDTVFYPDANGSLRLSYGTVKGFSPRDAVKYKSYTTLKGVIQKNSYYGFENPDYLIPEQLRTLYQEKDYGRYGKDSVMQVCFLSDCHTTGGHSGSPVLNGKGQLTGIYFDRVQQGVVSDIDYIPELTRSIATDIRYILFIIEKYAGAKHIIKELKIVE